ncbi:ribosomal protein S6 kinase delta-1 [Culicoides brevitarsis]|uniref:ribosomal protein S6 kinase delta-1 n=1 Tax=Culicoides brevitarsis TaxID=469753 RepID=UPI00307B1703
MASHQEKWIFSFAITETQVQKNYTTYKITSIIIPKNTPEALSCITVNKRFREVCKFYKEICRKACEAKIDLTKIPKLKNSTYFKRFSPEVIEERKNYIISLLNFIGDNPVLYRSEAFVKFFDTSLTTSCYIGEDRIDCGDELSVKTFLTDDLNNEETTFAAKELDRVMTKTFSERLSSDPDTNILIERLTEEVSLEKNIEDSRITDIEQRLKQLKEDSSFDYIYEAALKFTEAVESDALGSYQKAFDSYKYGIDILLCGVKNDSDVGRKKIVAWIILLRFN